MKTVQCMFCFMPPPTQVCKTYRGQNVFRSHCDRL